MMNRKRETVVVSAFAALALLFVAAVAALPGHTQSGGRTETRTESPDATTKLTVATRPNVGAANTTTVATGASSSAALTAATQQNALLKNNLTWTFGGKLQRGWYLYSALLGQTLGTERDAGTNEFAAALARWQTKAGLAATGVLDDETLYKMVSTWQSNRIKDRSYPRPDQVLTVPTSDFWDETRPAELRQVELEAYAAYKRMVAAAVKDPSLGLMISSTGELAASEKYLKIISSFRSREYQEQLRKASPGAGRAGLAVNSPHFTGRALDIYVGGEPVETKDANRAIQVNTPVYKWLVKNAPRFGFRPYYYEPWHWEYCPTCQ